MMYLVEAVGKGSEVDGARTVALFEDVVDVLGGINLGVHFKVSQCQLPRHFAHIQLDKRLSHTLFNREATRARRESVRFQCVSVSVAMRTILRGEQFPLGLRDADSNDC